MGLLVNGQWVDEWYNTKDSNGNFIRPDSQFRNWIKSSPNHNYAENQRYHLYISHACHGRMHFNLLVFKRVNRLHYLV